MPEEEFSLRNWFVPLTTRKVLIFLLCIGFILFFSGLFNNFVGDDNTQILDNSALRHVQNLPAFFLQNRLNIGDSAKLGATYYKPLLDTTYLILYQIFGPAPFWYHTFQLVLYLISVCFVFLFLKKFFALQLSFLLSVLFLVHPINAENVLYIADLQDILFFFFGMGALLMMQNKVSIQRLLLIGLLLLSSLFSKETGVLFIIIVPFYAKLFYKKIFKIILLPCFLSLFIYLFLRVHAIGLFINHLVSAPIQQLDFGHRLLNMPKIILFYLQTFFFPLNLSSSWEWVIKNIDVFNFVVPLLIVLLFIVAAFLIFYRITLNNNIYSRRFLFFLFWTIIGIGFHLQFIALDQTVAERWFYFSMVGMLGFIGVLIETWSLNLKNLWIITGLVLIILLFSFRTWVRTFDFRNDFTLAYHDTQVTSDSYNLEYMLSHEYYSSGYLSLALQHANRSVALFPYITNYTNLGAIKSQMGDYPGAKFAYEQALRYGDDSLPYENLSSLALVYGDRNKNIQFIKYKAIPKYPKSQKLYSNLALLEYMQKVKTHAKDDLKKAESFGTNSNLISIKKIFEADKPLRVVAKNGMVFFDTSGKE